MVYVWCMYGICMVWYGVCMVYACCIYGVWYGVCMVYVWCMVWCMYGVWYGLTYPYGGEVKKMVADPGPPLGSFTVVGWWLIGLYTIFLGINYKLQSARVISILLRMGIELTTLDWKGTLHCNMLCHKAKRTFLSNDNLISYLR